jgi:hypothetical protein
VRGCLSILVIAAVFVLAMAWIVGPVLAGTLIERSLSAAGFSAATTSVTVTSEPPLELIGGHADRVVISARDAELHSLRAATMSLTLTNVDLVGRQFGGADGTFDDVVISPGSGRSIEARSIRLRGAAAAATTTVLINTQVVERVVAEGIRQQTGLSVGSITLSAPNRIRFTAGLSLEGRFAVGPNGSLDVVTAGGGTRFKLFEPPSELRLTSVSVTGTDLVLVGTTSLVDLLR